MDDFNKFLDKHELLGTINVSTDDVCEYAGMGKDIGVFQRKKKITEHLLAGNPFVVIIKDNNKTIIYDDNE